ncbi:MAG: hypothetical protein JWM57_2943 [Phycisphaerales bacterium]|nr:hypothetical protein [Phycisphaerales bacterium]
MNTARWIYRIAGVYGLIALVPMLFTEGYFGQQHPPAPNHSELYFGFVTCAIAWQAAFLVIATDPARYRPLIPATWLEKAGFCIATVVLFSLGRLDGQLLVAGIIDGVLGVAFVYAWLATRPRLT